jgi:hypothetical protein
MDVHWGGLPKTTKIGDFLSNLGGHARGQHGPWMAQVDHVDDVQAKEIAGGGAGK